MLVESGGLPSSVTTPSSNGINSSKRETNGSLTKKTLIHNHPNSQCHPSPLKNTLLSQKLKAGLDQTNGDNKLSNSGRPSGLPVDVENRLANTPPHILIRSISSLSQQSIKPRSPSREPDGIYSVPAVRKGVLWQARDRLFSRWKERYFVLTKDYLACFRKGTTKYSEMGSFIFKVNLATMSSVGWEDRRGGPVLALALPREGKMLLRAKAGLDQWYRDLREATNSSRNRRNALKKGASTTHLNFISDYPIQNSPVLKNGSSNLQFSLSDSTPEIVQLCESVCKDTSPAPARNISRPSRFSVVTNNADSGSCEGEPSTPSSSVTSSNKFSSSTSSMSGSGGSSSLASSPRLRTTGWLRPASPARVPSGVPRSRFSLYEAPRDPGSASQAPKDRHSVCVEPRGLNADLTGSSGSSGFRRRPPAVDGSRGALRLNPRNPLLDLLDPTPFSSTNTIPPKQQSSATSPFAAQDEGLPNSTRPDSPPRPRAQSTSAPQNALNRPRSRTNLALFRHSGLFH